MGKGSPSSCEGPGQGLHWGQGSGGDHMSAPSLSAAAKSALFGSLGARPVWQICFFPGRARGGWAVPENCKLCCARSPVRRLNFAERGANFSERAPALQRAPSRDYACGGACRFGLFHPCRALRPEPGAVQAPPGPTPGGPSLRGAGAFSFAFAQGAPDPRCGATERDCASPSRPTAWER